MKQQENIKDQISKIKYVFQKSKIFNFLFVILIFTFLFLNLVSSQTISSIFFKFVNNDRATTVTFLKKIKTFPEFQKILVMNQNIYGKTITKEIFRQENEKKLMINNLEQQLTINPKARDVLYSLYQLYLAEGGKNQANEYLRQAKEIDPMLK